MHMRSRMLAAVLAVIFLVSMSACSSTTEDNKESSITASAVTSAVETASSQQAATVEIKKDPVTVTWFGGVSRSNYITTGIQDDAIMNQIKEETGVTIDHTPSIGVSDFYQSATVLIASQDLPDVMLVANAALREAVLNAKLARPLDDLIKTNGQELEKNVDKALKASKLLKSDDTHALYFIPHNVDLSDLQIKGGRVLDNGYNIRWDLYKKLGCPQITNDDEFLKVLQDMVSLEPQNVNGKPTYGLGVFLAEQWGNHMIDKAHGAYKGIVEMTTNVSIDVANDKIVARVTDPDSVMWESMFFYNKAYRLGLLDPESLTLKFDAFMNKAKTGRYMAAECNWTLGGADAQFIKRGTPEKGYVPLVYGTTENASFGTTQGIGDQNVMFVSSSCKNADRVMDVFNYLATDEGARLLLSGPEGFLYDMKDGKRVIKPETVEIYRTDAKFAENYGPGKYSNMQIRAGKDSEGDYLNLLLWPEVQNIAITDAQKDYLAYKKQDTLLEDLGKYKYAVYDMGLITSISIPQGSDSSKVILQADEYFQNNYAKAIVAKTEADYNKIKDEIISKCKALGFEQEVTIYSEQYEKYKGQIN